MPTAESIDLSTRLEEMAAILIRQRAEPALGAFDAVDLKLSAAQLRNLIAENEELKGENRRLRGVILHERGLVLDELARMGQEMFPEAYSTGLKP